MKLKPEIEKALGVLDSVIRHEAQKGLANMRAVGPAKAKKIIDSWFAALALLREELERTAEREEKLAQLESACYDGCATGDSVFDELKRTTARAGKAEAEVEELKDTNVWHQLCLKYEATLARWQPLIEAVMKGYTTTEESMFGPEEEWTFEAQDAILSVALKCRAEKAELSVGKAVCAPDPSVIAPSPRIVYEGFGPPSKRQQKKDQEELDAVMAAEEQEEEKS